MLSGICSRDPILDVIDELTKKKEFLAAEKTQMEATLESLGASPTPALVAAAAASYPFLRSRTDRRSSKVELAPGICWRVELQRRPERRFKSRVANRSYGRQ